MVNLTRIYTKTGDTGETSLGDGCRVPKTDLRISAYGGVDELNSILGITIASGLTSDLAAHLFRIQNDLFDLGADLCVPESDSPPKYPPLRVTGAQVEQLEKWIDAANEQLEPLTRFILPGGSALSSYLHLARTVTRRAERLMVALADVEGEYL